MGHLRDIDDVDDYLVECVTTTPEVIQEEFTRISSDLAYWNEKYTRAYKAFAREKVALEKVEAKLSLIVRARLEQAAAPAAAPDPAAPKKRASAKKDVTETLISMHVKLEPAWETAKMSLVDAEIEKVRLYGLLDALRTKKDMLVSIGAHLRAEMAGDPVIRERSRGYREQQEWKE